MTDHPEKPAQGGAPARQLTLLGIYAITCSMVMTVYEYPAFATSGFSLVFFLLLAGFLWCIPVALCAAEMATVEGWEEGGVFAWVSNTLGERWGFAAISFTFLQVAICYVVMLYFILGAVSYIVDWPELNGNPIVKTIAALVVLWVLAFTQFAGTKYTARLAKIGFFAGIVFPALLLMILAIWNLTSGAKLEIAFTEAAFIPDFTRIGTLVVFVAFILSYMGIEASATHVNEMANPGRDYPLAMFFLVISAILLSSIGGLSVASVIPRDEINLAAGVVQTFHVLITSHGPQFEWAVRVVAALLALGVLAEIAAWIVGPSRGMYVTAKHGILPQIAARVNKNGVPVPMVIFQLCITSVILIIFTNASGGNMSFMIAMTLTVVVYLINYFLLFIGYMQLVLKQKDKKRTFHVPGGTFVKILVACIGLIMSILAFGISFLPPTNLPGASGEDLYMILLVVCFFIVLAIPFLIYAFHNKAGKTMNADLEHIKTHNAPEGHFIIHPRARPTHIIIPHDQ